MIRKITGKNKNNKHVHIKSNENICSTTKDISNALGENFQKNSSSANYSETFQNIKQEREKEHLNFISFIILTDRNCTNRITVRTYVD